MDKKYTLEQLYKKGLISYKASFYIEMTNKYNQLMACKMSKGEAIKKVAEVSRVSTRTVYNALALINKL